MAKRERFIYGAGEIFATMPATATAPAHTFKAAVTQEAQVTIDPGSLNKVYGNKKFPAAVAQAEASLTAKVKQATLLPEFVQLVTGGSITAGGEIPVPDEPATIPATPFEVTVAGATDFKEDRGVIDTATGLAMVPVLAGATPITGQYKCDAATGKYTFATADTGHAVLISYTKTVTTGQTIEVGNTLMGAAATFSMDFYNVATNGKRFGMHIYAGVPGKFGFSFSNKGWVTPDLDIEGLEDANGKVFRFFNE